MSPARAARPGRSGDACRYGEPARACTCTETQIRYRMMLWVVVFGAYFFGTAFMLVDEEEERLHHRIVVAPPLVRNP